MGFLLDESPAIKALGPLFKLTEVHLWARDDGSSEAREASDYLVGKRNGVISGRWKATMKNTKLLPQVIDDDVKECFCNRTGERDSFDNVSNLGCENDLGSSGCSNILAEREATMSTNEKVPVSLGLKNESSAKSCISNYAIFINEFKREMESVNLEIPLIVDHEAKGDSNNFSIEVMQDAEEAACSKLLPTTHTDTIAKHRKNYSEEWITYWDNYYSKNYFYNVMTKEATWNPPFEIEHMPFVAADESTYKLVEMVEIDGDKLESGKFDALRATCYLQPDLYFSKELRDEDKLSSLQVDDSAGCWILSDCIASIRNSKTKKRVRKTKSDWKISNLNEDLQGVLLEAAPCISKYWCQRYLLFSRFDDGIKMDEEGWFSVTPEPLAKHHAIRCGSGSIIDFFAGVGGNAIQFAQRSKHVIAFDIDPNKINYAVHNASLYGVEDRIDFVRGDSFSLAPTLKADTVFMSPPWGGPDYTRVKKFDINTMLKPKDGKFLFNVGKRIAPKIVMFLPRNVDINQLAELSLAATPPWSLEVEKNFLNDRLKAVTAYFCEPPSLGRS